MKHQKEETMKEKNKAFRTSLMATLLLGALGLPLLAQQGEAIRTGKKAVIGLSSETRVGNLILPAGSYQVQHLEHDIVFRKVITGTYSGKQKVGREVGRVPCDAELMSDKMDRTETRIDTDPAGNLRITEFRIRGENVRHVF
jgi:hypothetical protein